MLTIIADILADILHNYTYYITNIIITGLDIVALRVGESDTSGGFDVKDVSLLVPAEWVHLQFGSCERGD